MIKIKLKSESSSKSKSPKSPKSSKSSKRSKGTKKKARIETKKSSKRKIVFLEKIKITKSEDKKHYQPPKKEQVSPKLWELPNRKTFYTWLNKNFKEYEVSQYEKVKRFHLKKENCLEFKSLFVILCRMEVPIAV